MSWQAVEAVHKHSRTRCGARQVLVAIATSAGPDGAGARPGVALIAERANLSERQVVRALKSLEADFAGEVRIERGHGRGHSHAYTLLLPGLKGADSAPPEGPIPGGEKVTFPPLKGDTSALKGDTFAPVKGDTFAIKGDICDTEKVTFAPLKGDICDTPHIGYARVREPSENSKSEPIAQQDARPRGTVGTQTVSGQGREDDPVPQHDPPGTQRATPDRIEAVTAALGAQGITATRNTITGLIERYGWELVARQVLWLPRRTGRNRLAILNVACRDDYEEPGGGAGVGPGISAQPQTAHAPQGAAAQPQAANQAQPQTANRPTLRSAAGQAEKIAEQLGRMRGPKT